MVALFAITIFTGSALLFLVQPMFARMVLPHLGGSPSVWNTAMVFYQAVLLAGYAYAHRSILLFGLRRQAAVQIAVLAVPLVLLPLVIPAGWAPPTRSSPIPWMLGLMAVTVGLPFFAVATMSPLLQRWFTATGHPQAGDPYFLYSASNLGSILALLSYPFVIEPHSSLEQQSQLWTWGYGLFLALAICCASCVWRGRATGNSSPGFASLPAAADLVIPWRRRLRWVLWAFVPSSLMLGVTNYLSSEVAVVPLLWIVPLALYLLTFVIAFAPRTALSTALLTRAFPILIVALVVAHNLQATEPLGWLMLLHLATFFVAALLCHGRLSADRPASSQLTGFYLWMSIGGVLGGMFNGLLAPLLFSSFAEYPIVLVLACFVALPRPEESGAAKVMGDRVAPLVLALFAGLLVMATQRLSPAGEIAGPGVGLAFGVPALACYFFSRRRMRFALGIGALFLVGLLYRGEKGRTLHAERSFFGVHRVTNDPAGNRLLVHGKTLHGMQSLDPTRRQEPLAYYHRAGPIGQVLALYGREPGKRIGVVGLGAGSLAAYALSAQPWTFFEIDPIVEKLARDERYFTFLNDSPAHLEIVLGDARRSLATAAESSFDLLILDAFSSDAIPVHLVTREALALYESRLAPGGILAFHISNLHLDLEPVLAQLAADRGLAARVRDDTTLAPEDLAAGRSPSIWLVLARNSAELAPLTSDARWRPLRLDAQQALWTDRYSSVLSIFRWR